MVILIGVLITAAIADMCQYKIPNLCIVTGMTAGAITTFMSYYISGVITAVVQMIIIFAVFYPLYLIGGLGAGDVKLFMVIGCWFRGERLFSCIFVTMFIAGIVSAIKMLFFRESRERLYYLGRYIRKIVFTGSIDEYEINTLQRKSVIRLSVPVLAGVILMYLGAY